LIFHIVDIFNIIKVSFVELKYRRYVVWISTQASEVEPGAFNEPNGCL